METTAEQQMIDLTGASKYSHDEASTKSCAYTQPPMGLLCVEDNSPVGNHNFTEELLLSQLTPDSSPSYPDFSASNLKDHELESDQSDTVADSMTNTSCSAAPACTTTDKETLHRDEVIPYFPSRRRTPSVQLDDTNNLQIINRQSSSTITQLPHFHSYKADEEIMSNSPLYNAPSSSLPPSSSPPQIFSSSPFASSQSSLVEIGHDYKVEDKAITADSGGQDPISSLDVVKLDIVEYTCNSQCDKQHELEDLAIQERSPEANEDVYDNHLVRKRTRTEEKIDIVPSMEDEHPAKRMKSHHAQAYLPPAPKRATMASQRQQFKKLIAPFRSPLMLNKDEDTLSEDLAKSKSPLPIILPPPAPKLPLTPHKPHSHHAHAAPSVTPAKTRVRTLKAASQFKSPLSSSASTSSGRGLSIRLTPTIQSLERKLQLLRRAVKVKENDEEMALVGLVKKWTEAGREVAYELWDLMKDSANNGLRASAWGEGGCKGRSDSEDRNWGWDSPDIKREGCAEIEMNTNLLDLACTNKIHLDEDEEARNNMSTMLRRLGIAPETLGWDEDTETFIN